MTDLFVIEGTTRKYWGAAVDGRVVHTAWGRLGGVFQRKASTSPTPAAAIAEYEKLVAGKRKKGYLDARPAPGSPALIADDHEHADIVYVDESGRVACASCGGDVARVRVAPAPPRPPPRPEVVTRPKKKEPIAALRREYDRLDRAAWNTVGARERAAIDRAATKIAQELNARELHNAGTRTPATPLGPVPGIELQREMVWPIAAALKAGTKLRASEVERRVRANLAKSSLGTRLAESLREKSLPVLRAIARPGAATEGDRIGGQPAWLTRPQWPSCSVCGQDMTFIAELAAGPSTGIRLRKGCRIYLFACAEHCFVGRAHGVVVQPNRGPERRPSTKVPAQPKLQLSYEPGVERPLGEDLFIEGSTARIAASLLAEDPSDEATHDTKIGGRPRWVQTPFGAKCSACKKPLEFIAQLDARMHRRTLESELWGDAGSFYLLMCREHEQGCLEFQCS